MESGASHNGTVGMSWTLRVVQLRGETASDEHRASARLRLWKERKGQ